jgi:hypothetical protein
VRRAQAETYEAAERQSRRVFETEEQQKESQTKDRKIAVLFAVFGLSAAVATLLDNFQSFLTAIRTLFHNISLGDLIGVIAHAQSGQTPNISTNQTALPIIFYGIYVVFTIAYIVCLVGLFFGKLPKDRANAMEMLKTLTAFFIGVISGKFV